MQFPTLLVQQRAADDHVAPIGREFAADFRRGLIVAARCDSAEF